MLRTRVAIFLPSFFLLLGIFFILWQGLRVWPYRGRVSICWLDPTSFCLPAYKADFGNPYLLTIDGNLPVSSQMQQEYFMANFNGAIEQFFSVNSENEQQTEYLIDHVATLAENKSLPIYLILASYAYEMNSGINKFTQADLFVNEIAKLRDDYEQRRLGCALPHCVDLFFLFDNRSSVEKAISHYFFARDDLVTYQRVVADLERVQKLSPLDNGKYDFVHAENLSKDFSYPRISICRRNRLFVCEKNTQKVFNYSCVGQAQLFVICNQQQN